MGSGGGLLALLSLVVLNGFFVAAEFALVSMRPTRISQLMLAGNRAGQLLDEAIHNINRYIAATQLGVTLASLGLGFLGEPAVSGLLEGLLSNVLPFDENVKAIISFIIAFAIVTYITILFGELVPKSLSIHQAERVALLTIRPLRLFVTVARPLVAMLNFSGNAVLRLFGLQPGHGEDKVHSPEELELLIRETQRAGLLDQTETEMLQRVFDFSARPAYAAMTPRPDLVAVDVNTPLDEVLQVVTENRYTRYPVYDGSLDNLVGVLNVHDLMKYLVQMRSVGASEFKLRQLMREPLVMPEGSSLEAVFLQMRQAGNQLVFLLDEYGGTSGAIASEDIVEEIFGDIEDEFDVRQGRVGQEIQPQPDGSLLVNGSTPLDRLNERLRTTFVSRYATTFGGWMVERLDHLPAVGEEIVTEKGYRLVVMAMEGRRIVSVRLTLPSPSP